ncbi:MSHA biogenesis protein MshK [Vibrio rotiferianus]
MDKKIVLAMIIGSISASSVCAAEQDPTAPLGWEKPTQANSTGKRKYRLPTLNSIVCKPDMPCIAIMNNKIVEQGHSLNGYRIASINSEYVTLKRGDRDWKLELFRLNVKQ